MEGRHELRSRAAVRAMTRRGFLFSGASLCFLPKQLRALNRPLLSIHWRSQRIQGDPPNGLMPFDSAGNWQMALTVPPPPANGTPFALKSLIVGVSLSHVIEGGGTGEEMAMIGHWSPSQRPTCDYISEEIIGGTSRTIWFPPGQQPEYWKGDFFDCHTSGNGAGHYIDVVFFHVPLEDTP